MVQSTPDLFSPSLHQQQLPPGADAPAANPFGHGSRAEQKPQAHSPETRQGFSKPWKKTESFTPRTCNTGLKHGPIRSKVTSLALLLNTSPAGTSTKTGAKAQDTGNPSDTQENTPVRRRQKIIRDQSPHKRNKHLQWQHRSTEPMFTLVAPFIPVP